MSLTLCFPQTLLQVSKSAKSYCSHSPLAFGLGTLQCEIKPNWSTSKAFFFFLILRIRCLLTADAQVKSCQPSLSVTWIYCCVGSKITHCYFHIYYFGHVMQSQTLFFVPQTYKIASNDIINKENLIPEFYLHRIYRIRLPLKQFSCLEKLPETWFYTYLHWFDTGLPPLSLVMPFHLFQPYWERSAWPTRSAGTYVNLRAEKTPKQTAEHTTILVGFFPSAIAIRSLRAITTLLRHTAVMARSLSDAW